MSHTKKSSIGFRVFSGKALAAVLGRPRRRKSPSQSDGAEGPATENESESARTAYARRREQVRRAQRNHRERKENYIKSLEYQLLQLRDEVTLRQEIEEANLENRILKDILRAYNIAMPHHQTHGVAEVSMVVKPGPQRYLRVRTGSSSDDEGTSSPPQSPKMGSHPYSLDSTQTGIDFVLSLEQPCLEHTYRPICAGETHGHALTVQAALLTYASNLGVERSWDIPTVELDRLLQLSLSLDLNGELTPVQAWNLIKTHPSFSKMTPERLDALRAAIAEKTECYGFGAVIDEHDLAVLIDRYLNDSSSL